MQDKQIGQKIIHLESVDSTNNFAANLIKEGNVQSGTVILADNQTNGRGQRENVWQSVAFKNLPITIIGDLNLWKIENLISINHIVALGVQKFIALYTNDVKIKWPNDIMVNGKKIAGILIENQLSSTKRIAVIGCGINVNQNKFDFPRATSLLLETKKNLLPKELVPEYLACITYFLSLYNKSGAEKLLKLFNENLWLKDKYTTFRTKNTTFEGIIQSSNWSGEIEILKEGKLVVFKNGEIKY